MKWILHLALLSFALASGMHLFAMQFPVDRMTKVGWAMESNARQSGSSDCIPRCIVKAHNISFSAITASLRRLLPVLLCLLAFLLLSLFLAQFKSNKPILLARPPDLIALYAHYLI